MRKLTSKKALAVIGTGALVLTGTGIAYAYWTATGTGSGSASTGDVEGITVVQTSVVDDLYPGGPEGSLSGTFTNPNSGPVYVGQVSVVIENADGTPWSAQADADKPACTAADFTVVDPAATDDEVLADGSSTWSGGTIALDNALTDQDNCKGVTPPLQYSSN